VALGRRADVGTGRFFENQTYHHAVLRALNAVATRGADISEVLQATTHIRAGDDQEWYDQWSALAERNIARAAGSRSRKSRGEALLRAHTYYDSAQFFLHPKDPKRTVAYGRCRQLFYDGLGTLGIAHEKIDVPYGKNRLPAVYYPAHHSPADALIVFHGGYDSILEELYFSLAAEANSRGYPVLTFGGPGQGAPLREQGLHFTHEWEKPTSAVPAAFVATHKRPAKMVLVGLSMGGYLAPRAAAFESRIDGVVSYDVMFDVHDVLSRNAPRFIAALRRHGRDEIADSLARRASRFDPAVRWALETPSGHWAARD
jgi:Alpha/beta hydrolase family